MEALFYYTGMSFYIALSLLVSLLILATLYTRVYVGSKLSHYLSFLKTKLFFKSYLKNPITTEAKEALEYRLQELKRLNLRKFEQRQLEKYLKLVPVNDEHIIDEDPS